MIVAVTGTFELLIAMKEAILPVPLAASPIDGVLLVQLYTVPGTKPVKLTGAVAKPLHTVWLATGFTVGIGLTVTVAVVVGPVQPLALGVIVKVTVIGALAALVRDPEIGEPAPLAGIPVTVATLSLVQVYVVPATGPLNTIGVIAEPEQIV